MMLIIPVAVLAIVSVGVAGGPKEFVRTVDFELHRLALFGYDAFLRLRAVTTMTW